MDNGVIINLLGLIGWLLFVYSSIPQLIRSWRYPEGTWGISYTTIFCILVGVVFYGAYVFLSYGFDTYLHSEYLIGAVVWGWILFIKYKNDKR